MNDEQRKRLLIFIGVGVVLVLALLVAAGRKFADMRQDTPADSTVTFAPDPANLALWSR